MFSILKAMIDLVKSVSGGIRKINIPTLLLDLISVIPNIISQISFLVKKDKKTWQEWQQLVDAELEGFDQATGDEGLTLIGGLPAPYQEEALDHIKELTRILLYNKIGVPGYSNTPGQMV